MPDASTCRPPRQTWTARVPGSRRPRPRARLPPPSVNCRPIHGTAMLSPSAPTSSAPNRSRPARTGAEGVGLMRTEFLFLERHDTPGEDEQFHAYRGMLDALAGRPLIVRTLDIGGDKQVPHLGLPVEENPFLARRAPAAAPPRSAGTPTARTAPPRWGRSVHHVSHGHIAGRTASA